MLCTSWKNAVELAADKFSADHPRARYAVDVILGYQRLSCGDLQGKAKCYSYSYARQRDVAVRYLQQAGVDAHLYFGHGGKRISGLPIGQDDYGNALYDTRYGVCAVNRTGKRICRV